MHGHLQTGAARWVMRGGWEELAGRGDFAIISTGATPLGDAGWVDSAIISARGDEKKG